jgi:hypothetical protein
MPRPATKKIIPLIGNPNAETGPAVIAIVEVALAREIGGAGAGGASTAACRRWERRVEAMESPTQPFRPVGQARGGPRASK